MSRQFTFFALIASLIYFIAGPQPLSAGAARAIFGGGDPPNGCRSSGDTPQYCAGSSSCGARIACDMNGPFNTLACGVYLEVDPTAPPSDPPATREMQQCTGAIDDPCTSPSPMTGCQLPK
jgi:hypothetical protein